MLISNNITEACREFRIPHVSVSGSATTTITLSDCQLKSGREPCYLVASITKPVVAMGALKLCGEGAFSLNERIGHFLPAYRNSTYRRITVRQLLTHSAGFPEMISENLQLRTAHADLNEFRLSAQSCPLDYAPGTNCRYSSVGFLLLGEIISSVAGQTCSDFLQQQFFAPLKMEHSWLGLPSDQYDAIATQITPCELPVWQEDDNDWNWNSSYWRKLGAPWGGLISTATDLARFAEMLLHEGTYQGQQILPASVVREAFRNQVVDLAKEPSFAGPDRGWGLGWRRQWPLHHASFGDFVSPDTVGHWGATGTLLWIDASQQRYAVVLTGTPFERSHNAIQRISNALSAQ